MSKREENGRDVAIAQLNEFYEARGVFEEDRIVPELTVEELQTFEYISEEEIEKAKEKADILREVIIKALMRRHIVLNAETKQFEYQLQCPPLKDGEPILSVIKFKKRYTAAELANNTVGLKAKDIVRMGYAHVASRCGISRVLFERLMIDDVEVCQAVAAIYDRK